MKKALLFICCALVFACAIHAQSKPIIIGASHTLTSSILHQDRVLNVYLPLEYSSKDSIPWNVLYVLDGGLDEDFLHTSGLVQYLSFPWIEAVKHTIVVGIANIDRQHDLTPPSTVEAERTKFATSGGSGTFQVFLLNEVMPFIENEYNARGKKTLVGQSLAGLFTAQTLLQYPTAFDRYIILSPSLWWSDGALLQSNFDALSTAHPNVHVFVGVGKEGRGPSEKKHVMEKDARQLYRRLKKALPKSARATFKYFPKENHATMTHNALYYALFHDND